MTVEVSMKIHIRSAVAPHFFPVGSSVVLHGLASCKDLEGKIGSAGLRRRIVWQFDVPTASRCHSSTKTSLVVAAAQPLEARQKQKGLAAGAKPFHTGCEAGGD